MKNVLITLFYADGLHGGVKYSAELGCHFIARGYKVYVAGVITNDVVKKYFNKYDIQYFNIGALPVDIVYDIVWAHHFPTVPYLIYRGLRYKRLINSCISNILLIERLMWFHENVDLYLTLTQKTKNMFVSDYNLPEFKIHVLPNTAPDVFFEHQFCVPTKLRNVVIVSNHPPRELLKAIPLLRKHGIRTTCYGGRHPVDITPEVLEKFDMVISIGKTVQYALAMGLPVYNYDHFGGSGFITPNNIDTEEAANFSGRSSFTKKTATEIAHEIVNQYDSTLQTVQTLKQLAEVRYKLSRRIDKILELLFSAPATPILKITNANRLFFDYSRFVVENSIRHTKARRNFIKRLFHI